MSHLSSPTAMVRSSYTSIGRKKAFCTLPMFPMPNVPCTARTALLFASDCLAASLCRRETTKGGDRCNRVSTTPH
eukprot:scaffold1616_cov310-Pinguiococcus_pyrenoidosus.AAC.32